MGGGERLVWLAAVALLACLWLGESGRRDAEAARLRGERDEYRLRLVLKHLAAQAPGAN